MNAFPRVMVATLILLVGAGWSAPPSLAAARAGKRGFICGQPWGFVSVEGWIVAADVPRTSNACLVFGKAIRRAHPAFPAEAAAKRATGTMVVIATISSEGEVVATELRSKGREDFEAAALSAARGWRFSPTTAAGKPVRAFAQIVFRFREGP